MHQNFYFIYYLLHKKNYSFVPKKSSCYSNCTDLCGFYSVKCNVFVFEYLCLLMLVIALLSYWYVCTMGVWTFIQGCVGECECACRMEPIDVQSQRDVSVYQYLTAEPENGWIFNMTLEHNKDMKTWGTWQREKEKDGEWQKGTEWDKVVMWVEGEEGEWTCKEERKQRWDIFNSLFFICLNNLLKRYHKVQGSVSGSDLSNLTDTTQWAQMVNALNLLQTLPTHT